MLSRNIEARVKALMDQFPVVAILGARQVGKTTLSKICAPSFSYYDLEDPYDYERISKDPRFFFEQHSSHVILDEAQTDPKLFQVLRGVIDRKREQNGRFIVTGSSSPKLLKNLSESLSGRVAIVELDTLKANEIFGMPLSPLYDMLLSQDCGPAIFDQHTPFTQAQVDQAWLRGGYPEPTRKGGSFFDEWMRFYQDTYLNRDVMSLFPRLNDLAYRRFIYLLADASGNIVNKAEFARAVSVSEKTINDYFDIAEGTFLWRKTLSYESKVVKKYNENAPWSLQRQWFVELLIENFISRCAISA